MSFHYPYRIDADKMHAAAQDFLGTHDFRGFCSSGADAESTVRTITRIAVVRDGDHVLVRVRGDGFLYNMVRAIAGTLTYVGSGKLAPADVRVILDSRSRENAGPTLPACGLFLNRLWYDHTPELDPFPLH